ncbi:MAG: hypothetical protein ACI8SN_002211, partial [Algoriphagus sp.]
LISYSLICRCSDTDSNRQKSETLIVGFLIRINGDSDSTLEIEDYKSSDLASRLQISKSTSIHENSASVRSIILSPTLLISPSIAIMAPIP